MGDLGVIDRFTETFIRYIDSGFGLLSGDVAYLTATLITIDMVLAGLFWAMDGHHDVMPRLIRKVLYVGFFALVLGNFQALSEAVYSSFAQLGLRAGNSGLSASDLLHPGQLAAVGFEAAHPLLDQARTMLGFPDIFGNALNLTIMVLAWFFVVIAFFILAVQLFITLVEFKLTSLAGFVLVPFALWSKTAFLAERVLGHVISSGIKIMVLAVIVGIGSSFFREFTEALSGRTPSIEDAMTMVLASLALLGLGIFGPGIAAGLVSGAPQLGAGAALGTAGAAAGTVLLAGGAAVAGARLAGGAGLAAVRAGASLGGVATGAYQSAQAAGQSGVGGIARAAGEATLRKAKEAGHRITEPLREAYQSGRRSTNPDPTPDIGGEGAGMASPASTDNAPAWARKLRAEQAARARRHSTEQAIKDGDRSGGSAAPSLDQKDD
ncbi:P-type conjugative transfer protein TrbL [Niveispirillum sp.]|uniref:P-type conjugative transfer protein TrbL n=1 Tax=Niveispirillum sp. TaxID=1917217 RepID=UPI001B742E58|nr:P-type conjugative transfer protein TrbL [Niveispirillum sp.]MBP7340234.1 P-type conjugative transfer protein TrbL [Niveispirillum sp.]